MRKRVYIASKFGLMEEEVQRLRVSIEKLGHRIIYDWTEHPIPKPFEEHIKEATKAAEAMAQAVMNCDILIVLPAERGVGLHIETGGAMVASIILTFILGTPVKEIYIVGEQNDRSAFYFHESVTRVPNIDSLLDILSANIQSP